MGTPFPCYAFGVEFCVNPVKGWVGCDVCLLLECASSLSAVAPAQHLAHGVLPAVFPCGFYVLTLSFAVGWVKEVHSEVLRRPSSEALRPFRMRDPYKCFRHTRASAGSNSQSCPSSGNSVLFFLFPSICSPPVLFLLMIVLFQTERCHIFTFPLYRNSHIKQETKHGSSYAL